MPRSSLGYTRIILDVMATVLHVMATETLNAVCFFRKTYVVSVQYTDGSSPRDPRYLLSAELAVPPTHGTITWSDAVVRRPFPKQPCISAAPGITLRT